MIASPKRSGLDDLLMREQAKSPKKMPGRWLQFSLRGFLVATVMSGLLFAWWRDRESLRSRLDAAEAALAKQTRRSWGVEQMTGPPDTPGSGDLSTAWASATPDDRKEWILLDYGRTVRASAVLIHETYNPGAVTQVAAFDWRGREVTVWSGTDPTSSLRPRGVSRIKFNNSISTSRIKIYLDSPKFKGWNEIDAVGIVDSGGRTHWAKQADASSCYATTGRTFGMGTSFGVLFNGPFRPSPEIVQSPRSH